MRTTFTMVNRNVQNNLSRRYSDMVQLQEQLATGKRLRKPSDNPVDVANDLKLRTKQTQLQQYKRNIEDGLAMMGVASSAMESMNELLHRMRELAVQGANDTNTTSERQYMQQEVDQLMRQMISIVNTQFKGDYIFNGTQTKIPPYELKASAAELTNYAQRTMAAYGGSSIDETIIRDASTDRAGEVLYLDFDPMLKVGDKIQMKWSGDDENAGYILPDTLPLDSFTFDVNGVTETFRKDVGDETLVPNPDYTVDYRTGEITILSERLRLALNSTLPMDTSSGSPVPNVVVTAPADPADPATNFQYSNTGTVQIVDIRYQNTTTPVTNILPGSLKLAIGDKVYIEGFGEHDPGYYDEEGVFHEGKNNYDYSVNYITGEITIYNMELMRDMRPDGPEPDGQNAAISRRRPTGGDDYYNINSFSLTFEYVDRGLNVHGDKVTGYGQIYRAIEEGITAQINIGSENMLTDKWTGLDMMGVMLRYSQALHTDDRDGIQAAITELTSMYDAVLNSQSQMGARIYRFELTLTRNGEQYVETSMQQSALEDADMAEVISQLMLSQNVYNAALQAAMRVLQPSLANFM